MASFLTACQLSVPQGVTESSRGCDALTSAWALKKSLQT